MLHPVVLVSLALDGGRVRLEPLRPFHAEDLCAHCEDPSVWTYAVERPRGLAAMQAFIEKAMRAEAAGTELPFAIVEQRTGRAFGSTRYIDIQPDHGGLEIGWTFLGVPWQRTSCNTECKLLLLRHAFERLGAVRVQFKADARNTASLRAIERIGGVYEGTLRKHRILCDGYIRDSVYYSVLRDEWPQVKEQLFAMLAAKRS